MAADALIMGRPRVFERGDRVYLTTPMTLVAPTASQIEEYAFASAVKGNAPNEHIGWVQGRFVEAGRPNLNNAMWLSDELAIKSLTPMLMPVSVMHDPRTSVGVIADCKLIAEEQGKSNARIDNVLAIWKHRYPEVWEEAEHNIAQGSMMQSMECFTPWYTCSECAQQYVKLPQGAERASWCDHLRTNSGRRILGDVCFTGTGLIFGSRGGRGAYTEAHLDHFNDEIAEFHARAHVDSSYRPTQRSVQVGLVQIEESELATLRAERNDARKEATELATTVRDLTTKVETTETAKTAAETRATAAETKVTGLEEKAQRAALKDTRLAALGDGFLAKLGPITKERLHEQASTLDDADWEKCLVEREEMASVKRDVKLDPAATAAAAAAAAGGAGAGAGAKGETFSSEEVAAFLQRGVTPPAAGAAAAGAASTDGAGAVRSLARSFAKKPAPAGAGASNGS